MANDNVDPLRVVQIPPQDTDQHRALSRVAGYLRDLGPIFDGGSDATRAEIAREWLDSFDDPDTCRAWMDAGFWSPCGAESVSSLGISPNGVAARCKVLADLFSDHVDEEIFGRDQVSAICNGNLDARVLLYDDE